MGDRLEGIRKGEQLVGGLVWREGVGVRGVREGVIGGLGAGSGEGRRVSDDSMPESYGAAAAQSSE